MSDLYEPFNVAERIAPAPATRDEATPHRWVRHFAATALAAHYVFRKSLPGLGRGRGMEGTPDLALLMATATSSTAAAVALLNDARFAAAVIWELTPELGALNGEWEEWLVATLDAHGVNPADIAADYEAGDFNSPSVSEVTR